MEDRTIAVKPSDLPSQLFQKPTSHRRNFESQSAPIELHAEAGDAALLTHNSVLSRAVVASHRRVVHLEFAASSNLPDGYEWQDYVSLASLRYTDA